MNDNFYKDSFEVYNISVTQKLVILGFSSNIFFILTSVTSETSWGLTMSFSDLKIEASKNHLVGHFDPPPLQLLI